MQAETASYTARSVAARRLGYDRVAAPHGDPAADDALARDVAAGLTPRPGRMDDYIRARTAFFDQAVVNALARGIAQVVTGGAGYDGRALRYGKPGVHWFEVDHPATQADKRARLSRLGAGVAHIRFIPADFTADPVAGPLLEAGLDPARPALFLFEGVAVYLEQPVTERVLTEFRAVTVAGSLLAISVSVGAATSAARARFRERVAEVGEPARTTLSSDQASDLLSAAGWEVTPSRQRQRSAGLLLARAAPAAPHRERAPLAPAPDTERSPLTPAPDTERSRLTPAPPAAPVPGRASGGPPASPPASVLPHPQWSPRPRRVPGAGGRHRGGLARPVRRRRDHRAPPGAGAAGRGQPAATVRRPCPLPRQLAGQGEAGCGPAALPDDPAPRRLPRRQLAARGRTVPAVRAQVVAERCGGDPTLGTAIAKEVLSMRLGKEEAVGYVEDTEADSLTTEEIKADQPQRLPVTAVTGPALPVS
jgi:methyltransferase (TIGR00027 family)